MHGMIGRELGGIVAWVFDQVCVLFILNFDSEILDEVDVWFRFVGRSY